jgi:stage III sporulation protein AD
MNLVKIIGIALVTTFAVLILRPTKPEIAALVASAGGILVLIMFVDSIAGVIGNMTKIADKTGIKSEICSALLKIIGIGYVSEFAAGICADAGNQSMAQKVILAGKVIILILALPIVNNLVEIIAGLL